MSIAQVLGYINTFLEHEKLKVIVIANEDEIIKCEQGGQYQIIKEKLIGKTFVLRPNTREALKAFTAALPESNAKTFFERQHDFITDIYEESETKNLRILSQSIMEADRVARCLDDNHWQHEDVVKNIIATILALAFEIRAARLTEDNLIQFKQLASALFREKDSGVAGVIYKLKKRYPELFDESIYLEGPTLREILYDGFVDADRIRGEINNRPPFRKIESEPAWKRIAALWEVNDDEFEKAIVELETEFSARKFDEPGNIFQVFGIRLLLSEMGALALSGDAIAQECKAYIDDIAKQDRIKNKYKEETNIDLNGGWDGFVFANANAPEFAKIFRHYRDVVDDVAKKQLPQEAQRLMEVAKIDSIKFYRQLCVNNVEPSIYHNVPILATLDPVAFVDMVLALPPRSQSGVLTMFGTRYGASSWVRELASEIPWLVEVKRAFDARMGALRPLSKFRLVSGINRNIVPNLPPETPVAAVEGARSTNPD